MAEADGETVLDIQTAEGYDFILVIPDTDES